MRAGRRVAAAALLLLLFLGGTAVVAVLHGGNGPDPQDAERGANTDSEADDRGPRERPRVTRSTEEKDGAPDSEPELVVHLFAELGRIRQVRVGPDGMLYLLTGNRDGRGQPRDGDDRLVRVDPEGLLRP